MLKFENSLLRTKKHIRNNYTTYNEYCDFITPPQGGLLVAPMNTQPNSHGQKPHYKWNTNNVGLYSYTHKSQ